MHFILASKSNTILQHSHFSFEAYLLWHKGYRFYNYKDSKNLRIINKSHRAEKVAINREDRKLKPRNISMVVAINR